MTPGYVAGLLPNIPQKQKSPIISHMWKFEPLKAQWEVMARAYTFLRDNFDLPNLTLADFTQRAAQQFGIPAPDQYISLLGWQIQTSWANAKLEYFVSCRRNPERANLDLGIECISMEDLIKPYRKDPNVTLHDCGLWPLENAIAIQKVYDDEDPVNLVISDAGNFEHIDNEWTFDEVLGTLDESFYSPGDIIYQPAAENLVEAVQESDQQLLDNWITPHFPTKPPNTQTTLNALSP